MKRDVSLDIIRIVACAMIVLIHSPHPESNEGNGLLLVLVSYLTAPGIGLFFMVSGALALGDRRTFDVVAFLKKRVVRILIPLAFWSALGSTLSILSVSNDENAILWFMYCIFGLYLLAPILRRWMDVARAGEIELYLLIWAVTLCIPIVEMFVEVNTADTSWLYYFHGYAGYYVLGGYMNKYWGKSESLLYRWRRWLVLIGIVASVFFPVAMRLLDVQVDFYRVFWYLSISVVMMCVAWWIGLNKVGAVVKSGPGWVARISSLTFGVYLVHILIMRNVLWQMEWMVDLPGGVQILVCDMLTFVLSLAVCYGVSKVKYLRAVIGL